MRQKFTTEAKGLLGAVVARVRAGVAMIRKLLVFVKGGSGQYGGRSPWRWEGNEALRLD